MKNFTRLVIMLLFFALPQFTKAQTRLQAKKITKNYNMQSLKEIEKTSSQEAKQQKINAIRIANQRNLEVKKQLEDGSFAELQRVDAQGNLIYYRTFNVDASASTRTNYLNTGGGLGLNLMGQNMRAHVWDAGLARSTHQEYDGPGGTDRFTIGDDSEALDYHAAHVTGTIMASGLNPDAKGMAPHAFVSGYDWNDDFNEASAAALEGMLISNHSYGYDSSVLPEAYFGAYIGESAAWDNLHFFAPYYLMVVAAGNDGNASYNTTPLNPNEPTYDKLTGHSTSKNNLVIANAQDATINTDGSLASVTINNSSSQGPTDDYRIKPDITGNGTLVYSTYDNNDAAYASITGTSMASPNVAGSLLLLQEHAFNLTGDFLRSATLKGLALHTADDAGIVGPDANYGWGLLNAKRAAETLSQNNTESIVEELTLTDGDSYTITVQSNGIEDLQASITWTDPAGTAIAITNANINNATPALVNDLDLRVTKNTTETHYPWRLTDVNTNANDDDNDVDNIERVDVAGASGEYTITVTHKGTLEDGFQDFSLIVTGVEVNNFNITPTVTNKTHCSDETATFDINLNSLDSFSGTVNFSTSGLPQELTSSFSTTSLTNEGTTSLTISDLANVSPGIYTFSVTADSGSDTSIANLNLEIIDPNPLAAVVLLSPEDEDDRVGVLPTLDWETLPNASLYQVQVATDNSFNTIIMDETLENTSIKMNQTLEAGQTYYWRVRGYNDCVTSTYTSASFETHLLECLPYKYATDTPISIPQNSTDPYLSLINVPTVEQDLVIQDINVSVDISHTSVSDLYLLLIAPNGNYIQLIGGSCSGQNDIDVVFDDDGAQLVCNSSAPAISGTVIPQHKLSNFIGESPAGDWALYVVDDPNNQSGDGGTINDFGIEICYAKKVNDDACDAIAIGIDDPSTGDAFSLAGGTAQTDEPSANTDGSVNNSLWFSFVAPASGAVEISTAISGGTLAASEIAVYSNSDCGDFSKYDKIEPVQGNTTTSSTQLAVLNYEGLTAGATYYVQVDTPTGVDPGSFGLEISTQTLSQKSFSKQGFNIYPNPVAHTLQVSGIENEAAIQIYDLLGKQVIALDHVSNNQAFDVSSLSSGVYIVKVTLGDNTLTRKIIKE